MLLRANPNNHLPIKITELINKYPTVPFQFIGVPTDDIDIMLNWQNEPLWQ
jgi:hypothetical protein